jgi:hypothetical protein
MNAFQFTTVSALLTDRTSVEVTQVARKDRSRKNCDPLFCWHLERRMVEVNRRGFTNQFEDDSRFAEDFDHAASFVETRA